MRQELNWGLDSALLTFQGMKLRPGDLPDYVGLGHSGLKNILALSICKVGVEQSQTERLLFSVT